MRLGLDTYSYHYAAGLWEYTPRDNAPMSAYHFLQKAVELNLDGVHFCDPRHFDTLEYGYVSQLREKAEALGLYLELGTGGTNPDHLEHMVRAAHVAGASVLRTFVGKPRPTSAKAIRRMLSAAAAELQQVVPVCERYGVSVALENHQDLTSEELLALLELVGSDQVGICLDTGNPLALLEDPLEAAGKLVPFTRSVHLKDYQVVARPDGFAMIGCALGEGVVDLPAILELLASQGLETNLNLETHVGKQFIPALSEEYLAHLPGTSASALGDALRLVRDRGLPAMPQLPLERAAPEDEVLADEDDLVLRSVRWAQGALGRPEPEL